MKQFRTYIPRAILGAYHMAKGLGAALYFGFPARSLTVLGVTGTDGKTTTTNMLAAILRAASVKVSWISTISARIGKLEIDTGAHTTTPSPFILQSFLRRMVRDGDTHAVLEVTSHGIDQERIFGIPFKVAVLTNVTPEHLDYHGTYDAYLRTKVRLLQKAQQCGGVAIINRDDRSFEQVHRLLRVGEKIITYGEHADARVRATDILERHDGSDFVLHTPAGSARVTVPIPGRFNISNALAAAGGAYALNISPATIAAGIADLRSLAGRMEEIPTGRDFRVIVDFAHTPNAIENLLRFWRPHVKGKIIIVFGSAGERDAFKRPLMGEAAGRGADFVVLTREDNRSESLVKINHAIREGLERAGKTPGDGYVVIDDRAEAIAAGIHAAHAGDLVLITGKGPESGLNVDGKEILWDDREVAKRILRV